MDKAKAIDLLDNLIGMIEDNRDNDYDTAFRMAIDALKAQLSQEGTTSDTISKMETVEHLRRVLDATVPVSDYDEGYVDGVEFGISTVSTMPTIQPETAKRIVGKSRDGITLWYQCNMCNEPVDEQDNYCRGCGRMLIDG